MNSPKSFNNGGPSSNNGINHAIVDQLSHVPTKLNQVASIKEQVGCI